MFSNFMQNAKCKMQNANGFSLISILVAASLLGGLSMVVMEIGKQSTKSTAKMNFDTEVSQITNEINGILSDPTSCKNTVAQSSLTSIIKNIPNNPTPVNKYDINQGPYGNGSVKIASYVLNLTGADAPNLQINFQNKAILKNQSGSNSIVTRMVKLDVTPASAAVFGDITSCRSVSTATDTMWSRQLGNVNNIYYNSGNVGIGTTAPSTPLDVKRTAVANTDVPMQKWDPANAPYGLTLSNYNSAAGIDYRFTQQNAGTNYPVLTFQAGNVGIGTVNPAAKLEVTGTFRPGPVTLPSTCTLIGTQGYNSATGAPVYCDGTNWVAVGGGSTQTWQNTLASRSLNTTYTNTTAAPITVSLRGHANAGALTVSWIVNGSVVGGASLGYSTGGNYYGGGSFLVPAGASYQVSTINNSNATLDGWNELK
jgi:archaellum component FlaG (FlaF/FlaG flagellin family)